MRSTAAGQKATSFSVAVGRRWIDKDGQKQESTEFINVVFWGKLAEIIAQYAQKGQVIYVEGRIATREWEKNGEKRKITEVIGQSFQFGPKPANQRGSQGVQGTSRGNGHQVETKNAPQGDFEANSGNRPEDLPF